MPTIKGQVLATTELDSHGEKLSREQLHTIFSSLPSEMVIYHQHDFGRPPVAIARNLRFIELPSKGHAIIADVSIHDEDAYSSCGGFSLAWLADEYTIHPHKDASIKIYFNPRIFSKEQAIELISASTPECVFNARELKQKSAESVAILLLKFVSASALAGFFGKAGSDAYDALLKRLICLSDAKKKDGEKLVLHLIVPAEINSLGAEIVLELSTSHSEHLRLGSLSYQSAVDIASRIPHANNAKKIVLKSQGEPPKWVLSHYIKSDGMPVRI